MATWQSSLLMSAMYFRVSGDATDVDIPPECMKPERGSFFDLIRYNLVSTCMRQLAGLPLIFCHLLAVRHIYYRVDWDAQGVRRFLLRRFLQDVALYIFLASYTTFCFLAVACFLAKLS